MSWTRALITLGLAGGSLVLTGCAPHPMESVVLAQGVAEATIDPDALAMCSARGTGADLISALDSNGSEVRDIGQQVDTRRGWDDNLPEGASSYVAICIYDVGGQSPPYPKADYMAQWAAVEELFKGNGVLTFW